MSVISPEDQAASTEDDRYLTDAYSALIDEALLERARASGRWTLPHRNSVTTVLEFYRIGVIGYRQSGKTETIVRMLRDGDWLVSYNKNTSKDAAARIKERYAENFDFKAMTAIDLLSFVKNDKAETPKRPRHIWIDDAHWSLQKVGLERLAKALLRHYPSNVPVIITIG